MSPLTPATDAQVSAIHQRMDELGVAVEWAPRDEWFRDNVCDTDLTRLSRQQASDALSTLREEFEPDEEA